MTRAFIPSRMSPVIYQIDREDRIIEVNEGWATYASATGVAETLADSEVVGRKLWSSISDPTTAELYQHMLKIVRGGGTVNFHYRCDVPEYRRVFKMQIEQAADDCVKFTSTLASEERRPSVALLELRPEPRVGSIRMCSWCQRVAGKDGTWTTVEQAIEDADLLQTDPLPRITHGICEDCASKMRALLGELEND